MSVRPERLLILSVDRDNDLGEKTKVQSPVVGRAAVLDAATKLALSDPEEADANAMFAAVKAYDKLAATGVQGEVAVVCGDANRGFDADRRVSRDIQTVIKGGEYTGVIFVSDGGEDEQVMPLIQSLEPIVSVERVTIKQSRTVEESYQILGRYLRMLVFDPHYSRWSLGVPGVIFLLAGVLIALGQFFDAELATLLIIGGAFLVRGFSIDRTVAGLLHRGPTGYMRLFSMVTSVLVVVAGLFTGYSNMVVGDGAQAAAVYANSSQIFVYGGQLAGWWIIGSLNLVWAGIAIYAIGALLSHVARESNRWRRDGFVLVMLGLLYLPVQTFSAFLKQETTESTVLLISYILLGLAAIFVLTLAIYPRVRARGLPERE
jgi:putative membrane protein